MDSVTSIDVNAGGSSPEEQGNQIILPDYMRAYVQRSMEKEKSTRSGTYFREKCQLKWLYYVC